MEYTSKPSEFAPGYMAVKTIDNSGYKTRTARLAEYYADFAFSVREDAYIITKENFVKFEFAIKNNYDAINYENRHIKNEAGEIIETRYIEGFKKD